MSFLKQFSGTLSVIVLAAAGNTAQALPFADNIGDAGELVIGAITAFDNSGAGTEAGEPSGGTGSASNSCLSQDGWCLADPDIQNSMWAWITAPTGLLSIDFLGSTEPNTDGYDLQFALWSAADAGDFSTFTKIAANDDSSPSGFGQPYIAPVALVAGSIYYLQVDGFKVVNAGGDVSGEIVEYGQILASETRQPAPAPSVLALFGLGLAALGLARRKA